VIPTPAAGSTIVQPGHMGDSSFLRHR
jgi:hypothetical protein